MASSRATTLTLSHSLSTSSSRSTTRVAAAVVALPAVPAVLVCSRAAVSRISALVSQTIRDMTLTLCLVPKLTLRFLLCFRRLLLLSFHQV